MTDPTSLYILAQVFGMNFDEPEYPKIEIEHINDEENDNE